MRKLLEATALIALSVLGLASTASAGLTSRSAPVGVVVVGQKALLGSIPLTAGTSLFDGDTVSTQGQGALRIRLGAAQLWLGENSSLTLQRSSQGAISAKLRAGTLRFSGAAGSPLQFGVLSALIRGKQPESAGQLAVIGANEFQVGATSGALIVDVDGDIRTVEESTAYDATLSDANPQMPFPAGHHPVILVWLLISLVAFGTVFAVIHARMSPSNVH